MNRIMLGAVGLSAALLISGAPERAVALQSRAACGGAGVSVDGDFEQAGFAACSVSEAGDVTLHIRPETEPINPSPWYAARLTQAEPAGRRVLLSYQGARHRYQPWFSPDGRQWQRLTLERPTDPAGPVSTMLPAFSGSAYISAQPLVPLAAVSDRWSQLVAAGQAVALANGSSINGRAVPLYRVGPANAARLHVVATRQHPPETGGAAAFDAFSDHLIGEPDRQSCATDAIVFAPIVNPDGIALGHWRTNAGLVDLNRDWGRFTQPETRAIGGVMTDLARSARIVSVLDFHSTREGAIYVSRTADARAAAFAAAVAQQTGLSVVRTRAADGETLKSWSEARFGSASFTIELPDSASPQDAETIGRAVADVFVRFFVCTDPGASR